MKTAGRSNPREPVGITSDDRYPAPGGFLPAHRSTRCAYPRQLPVPDGNDPHCRIPAAIRLQRQVLNMNETLKSGSTARQVATRTPVGFLAFGFGSGLAPKAPGTAGTLMGMLVGLPLAGVPLWAGLAIVGLAFLAGIPICQKA